ncbi:hypothetical protein F7725_008512 [Dissostichus mawsoni]|uniref:Immunoglobulin V-set domain-containing protein n=1 Tax=Dissostichus mawsoni TaxID=36200 RepID=A0A7J5Y9D3_DISMA|nr:hypothetical protein F7725_008512 [Dissostichus mawsoni]
MELIVFTRSGVKHHDFGEFSSKDKFSATKPDAESGTFTVKDLQPGDKGLYFCAVSQHSASYSDSVFQTPPFIMKRSGESVDREINCSHSIPSYDRILWYKQDQHQNMKFLGYLNVKYPYQRTTYLMYKSLVDGNEVYQTEILWRNKGEDATMSCRYTKDASYNQMYWYRQLPGETMEQIVYTKISRKDHDFGGFSSKKF